MKAKDQEKISGIYYTESGEDVKAYFVRKVGESFVEVSTVETFRRALIKVLDDRFEIPIDEFKEFNFSGDYRIWMINGK